MWVFVYSFRNNLTQTKCLQISWKIPREMLNVCSDPTHNHQSSNWVQGTDIWDYKFCSNVLQNGCVFIVYYISTIVYYISTHRQHSQVQTRWPLVRGRNQYIYVKTLSSGLSRGVGLWKRVTLYVVYYISAIVYYHPHAGNVLQYGRGIGRGWLPDDPPVRLRHYSGIHHSWFGSSR